MMNKQKSADQKIADIVLPDGYDPLVVHPPGEPRVAGGLLPQQRAYFLRELLAWKQKLLDEAQKTVATMHDEKALFADPTDRASLETERNFELRTRDRERKLIAKIDKAIQKIEEDSYGYCDVCDAPISIRRLQARLVSTLCIECKTREERDEKQSYGA